MKVINQTLLEKVIIERSRSSHKGDYGRLLLLGGTYPYGGAIIMAALAAVKSGAGLVTVGTDRENIPALHSHLPEPMAFSLQDQQLLKEQLEKAEVVLLGLVYETMLLEKI
ncbi:sugar kinase [Streptococcus pneumoniae]|nr:sugar kinase [Streptococcus pneumoniae]